MGLKATRKTANTLMLIPTDIMFVLNIMLLVYVWQNSGIEHRGGIFFSACLGLVGCIWLTKLVLKERKNQEF